MFELGNVIFNFDYIPFWIAVAMWCWMLYAMPKRALIGMVVGVAVSIWFMMSGGNPTVSNPTSGENIYVGCVFLLGFVFTSMMSPLAIVSFFVGYKMAR